MPSILNCLVLALAYLCRMRYVEVTISRKPGDISGTNKAGKPWGIFQKALEKSFPREWQPKESPAWPKRSFVVVLCGNTDLDVVHLTLSL
jgi:hypothetical protein